MIEKSLFFKEFVSFTFFADPNATNKAFFLADFPLISIKKKN